MYAPVSDNFASEVATHKKSNFLKVVAVAGLCAICCASGFALAKVNQPVEVEPMFATVAMGASSIAGVRPSVPSSLSKNTRGSRQQAVRYTTRISATPEGEEGEVATEPAVAETAAPAPAPAASVALPFAEVPDYLNGLKIAGNDGFDPFNFGADGRIDKMREAEIKHGRLAMLAAAGWPISERLDPVLAKFVNMPVGLNADGTNPSLLNGGLDKVSIFYWGAVLGAAAAIELKGLGLKPEEKVVGDFGFDPAGFLKDANEEDTITMQRKELKHGRTAMLAVLGFAVAEAANGTPVSDLTPGFFEPFWDLLS